MHMFASIPLYIPLLQIQCDYLCQGQETLSSTLTTRSGIIIVVQNALLKVIIITLFIISSRNV
jgi:hypothetical protein